MKLKVIIEGEKDYIINELTIRDYYNVKDLIGTTDTIKAMELVNKLCDIPISELRDLKPKVFNDILVNVGNLINKSLVPNELSKTLLGYELISLDKMSVGALADISIYSTDNKIHSILSILYRPKDEISYDSELCNDRAISFLDIPFRDALAGINFFLGIRTISLKNIQDYLELEVKRGDQETKKVMSLLLKETKNLELLGIGLE